MSMGQVRGDKLVAGVSSRGSLHYGQVTLARGNGRHARCVRDRFSGLSGEVFGNFAGRRLSLLGDFLGHLVSGVSRSTPDRGTVFRVVVESRRGKNSSGTWTCRVHGTMRLTISGLPCACN